MDPIWADLPYDLVRRILGFVDDIDTRLKFKIPPRKLKVARNFEFRSEIVYDNQTQSLYDFSGKCEGFWLVRHGIKFSQYRSPGLHIFNMEWEPYQMTMYAEDYILGPSVTWTHFISPARIKFK
jgi:hypothetical protein